MIVWIAALGLCRLSASLSEAFLGCFLGGGSLFSARLFWLAAFWMCRVRRIVSAVGWFFWIVGLAAEDHSASGIVGCADVFPVDRKCLTVCLWGGLAVGVPYWFTFFIQGRGIFLYVGRVFVRLVSFLGAICFVRISFSVGPFGRRLAGRTGGCTSGGGSNSFRLVSGHLVFCLERVF